MYKRTECADHQLTNKTSPYKYGFLRHLGLSEKSDMEVSWNVFFPNNSCYCRIFHEINHLFGGSPIYGTPRIPESLGWSFFPVQIAIKCAGNSRGHRGHPLLGRPKKTRSGADKDTVHWCLWFKVAFYTYMYIYEYIYIYVYKPTLCKLYIYIYTYIYI